MDANPDIPSWLRLSYGFQTDSEMSAEVSGGAVVMSAVKGAALTKLSSVEFSSKS